jgi:hypothetical protein
LLTAPAVRRRGQLRSAAVSLRGRPVEEIVVLPDGRSVTVRIAVPDDSYIAKKELDTVALELWAGEEALGAVNTVLEPGQVSEAKALARDIAAGLASGDLAPTAGAVEPLATRFP